MKNRSGNAKALAESQMKAIMAGRRLGKSHYLEQHIKIIELTLKWEKIKSTPLWKKLEGNDED